MIFNFRKPVRDEKLKWDWGFAPGPAIAIFWLGFIIVTWERCDRPHWFLKPMFEWNWVD